MKLRYDQGIWAVMVTCALLVWPSGCGDEFENSDPAAGTGGGSSGTNGSSGKGSGGSGSGATSGNGNDGGEPGSGAGPGGAGESNSGGTGGTGGTGGSSGTGNSAGAGGGGDTCGAGGASSEPFELLTIGPCGLEPTTTVNAYSGLVTITVSGTVLNFNSQNYDAFYRLVYDAQQGQVVPYVMPEAFRYNRFSESGCLCDPIYHTGQCPDENYQVSDILTQEYPPHSETTNYTVEVDLGAGPAERLRFSSGFCGCAFEDSGQWSVYISQNPDTCDP